MKHKSYYTSPEAAIHNRINAKQHIDTAGQVAFAALPVLSISRLAALQPSCDALIFTPLLGFWRMVAAVLLIRAVQSAE